MEKYLELIQKSPLFAGIETFELNAILKCLDVKPRSFSKNEFILRHGDKTTAAGLVLSGAVHIIQEDFWGNRSILAQVGEAQIFGEAYACQNTSPLSLSVVASQPAVIAFLDIGHVLSPCQNTCAYHTRLIRNLLSILAEKNIVLTKKMEHMNKRSTKEKLLSFLSSQFHENNSPSFAIPFNRQELADYLAIDRSAMSSELSKLQKEGVLRVHKNNFCLLNHSTEKYSH